MHGATEYNRRISLTTQTTTTSAYYKEFSIGECWTPGTPCNYMLMLVRPSAELAVTSPLLVA